KDIINASYSWVNHFSSIHNAAFNCCPKQTSIHQNSGGVICDGKGKWILRYNRSLGKCLVAVVELWGILDGLLLLQKQGYAKVIIQSDNLENVISIYESKFDGQKAL
ncbi:hypothetical protein Gotur_023412, partial [Gossypium turneri]